MPTTFKGQDIIDSLRAMPLLANVFNSQVPGFSLEPGLTILNETFAKMFGENAAWKFNEVKIPSFVINSYQQDYAQANVNIGFLMSGECLDVNNTALPKAQPQVEVVKDLPRASTWVAMPPMFYGVMKFQVSWNYNSNLYYGIWGDANTGNPTRGNNPQPGSTYVFPLVGGQMMPFNPITQIIDANGNLLVLTTYGTTGNTAPVLPAASPAGTVVPDGSCIWTVVDPTAQGFRIWPVPSQSGVVWSFHLRAQAKPPAPLTSLDTLLTPIPDEYIHIFRQGCITTAYRYSPEERVRQMYGKEMELWESVLMKGRIQGDREAENHSFVPTGGVVSAPSGTMPITPGNPFGVGGA